MPVWGNFRDRGNGIGSPLTSIPISNPPPSPAIPMAEGADHSDKNKQNQCNL